MNKAVLFAALIAIPLVPALAATAGGACPGEQPMVQVSGDYYYSFARNEFWKEENGWPGIQIRHDYCPGFGEVEPDVCVTGAACPVPDSRGAPGGMQDLA